MDFYGIDWQYEPTTFVLEADADGNPSSAFSPDFYLPAFDCYLELTTQRQPLVTKKNRKVRLLREQQPDIDVKILYRRDYEALISQFGLSRPAGLATAARLIPAC